LVGFGLVVRVERVAQAALRAKDPSHVFQFAPGALKQE